MMTKAKSMIYVGIDLSLNHGAFFAINGQGQPVDVWSITGTPNEYSEEDKWLARLWPLPKRRKLSRDTYDLVRLKAWKLFIDHWLAFNLTRMRRGEIVAAIEGYAFAAQSSSTYQIGGLGEMVKLKLVSADIPLRIYDPQSIKLFVTGKGNTDAITTQDKAAERWKMDLKSRKDVRGDLLTALSIAKLLQIEWKIRNGTVRLENLHKDIIHIFKKSTKTRPMPVLDSDWIGWTDKDFEV